MVRREYNEKSFTNARGGKGIYSMQQILLPEEMLGHGRLFARAAFPPNSSIGWHKHIDEIEVYYILSGEALYTDEDGSKTVLKAGDTAVVGVGKCHAMENLSDDTPLEAIFLIINAEGKTEGYAETVPV